MYSLPNSRTLNISALSGLFNSTTNSYKYLYFLSLLDIIKRSKFDDLKAITFRDIIVEMLANAWYPNNYFKLSFGTQDQIANKLNSLNLEITEPILKFKDPNKKILIKIINNHQNIDNIVNFISRHVPYRLIRPFFTQETRGFKDYDVNPTLINLATDQFNQIKPLYCFNGKEERDCDSIILHPDWIEYLEKNYTIVRGWVSWEWLNYMQQRNPNTPNLVNKLFVPQKRDSLTKQKKYWQAILDHQEIECIYSKIKLDKDKDKISLDHYIPWSFVAHDQLWNLIPTTQSVNSSKSNNLASMQYFNDFVKLQHIGLTISHENMKKNKWEKEIESFISELKVNQSDHLLDLEILTNAYESTINPLISLAKNQGFSEDWIYSK
ncbi:MULTISPECIES: HNH endonuclease domain-containing protein [Spirulina sp. CCY15215]|uniref:HNH endonuclease domain-containing protein n=1 Tax=Spirulina sp. CCY15215 TaxID=2767591 RepID=UPI00194DC7FC|nr:HNH endonuclease domain-containing protein [Spirulina major]